MVLTSIHQLTVMILCYHASIPQMSIGNLCSRNSIRQLTFGNFFAVTTPATNWRSGWIFCCRHFFHQLTFGI